MRKAVVLLAILLLVATLGFGCGGEAEKKTTEDGGEAAEDLFTVEDLPTEVGNEWRYYSNPQVDEGGQPVVSNIPVSFTFEGPWDFTEGPTEGEVTTTIIEKEEAPESEKFPDAEFVTKGEPEPGYGISYAFMILGSDCMEALGTVGVSPSVVTTTDIIPPLEYPFPWKKGLTWECSCQVTQTNDPGETDASTGNYSGKVLGVNQVKTPLDTYDTCFLLQLKQEVLYEGATVMETVTYSWYVPGVGSVVTISCIGGEVDRPPTEAATIQRIKSFSE